MIDNIDKQLKGLAVPIDSVQVHPRNPRQGDVGAVAESLTRFGQKKPIVVQASTGFVVAGNHLLMAARQLGWTKIAANVADMDDREAMGYLLADNRTSDLGTYDQDILKAILIEEARAGNLAATGYDGDDVDAMVLDLLHPEKQSGEPGEAPQLRYITFGDHKVLISSDELDRFIGAWRGYLEREGTDVGFLHEMIEALG